jgi:hypothetical protein
MSSYLGEQRFVSAVSGEEVEVKVRRKLVDATYLEGSTCGFSDVFAMAVAAGCADSAITAQGVAPVDCRDGQRAASRRHSKQR